MYKIYINDNLLVFSAGNSDPEADALVAPYRGKVKFLHQYIDLLEKTDRYQKVELTSPDPDALFETFASLYKLIEAAGGVVVNPAGKVLFIHRLGFWDLPKGKIDPGESPEEAAVREVWEETGIQEIQLGSLLQSSYHTYKTPKGKRVLKRTYWFMMEAPNQVLIPQTTEYIEEAVWKAPAGFLHTQPKIYKSISDVLASYLAQKEAVKK
ncbi:MAG: NUDIX hydrolase [Saprospiraceae bacterium]|nr:NUDIX hydrolase [Saprospiraceae bacterium]